MPLANLTAVANLALDHLGEPYLTDYATDTGTTADAVRLHLPQCVETVLEGHVWSFATRCAELAAPAKVAASLILDPTGIKNAILLTAVTAGRAGNAIRAKILAPVAGDALTVSLVDSLITIAPITASTAAQGITALNADADIAALVTAANSGTDDGTGALAAVAEANLTGGSDSPDRAEGWGSSFTLPSDCLRVLEIDDVDVDLPRNDFEIQGRYLLLAEEDADAPLVNYISSAAPVSEWPTTFTDAVAFLLAARLAPKLAQDQNLAASFLQRHEMALGKARSKDTRETRSKENFGPRQLAARSGLVRARYGNNQPPY